MPSTVRTICSSALAYGEEAFSSIGPCRVVDPAAITRETLAEADALCIRSTTRVNQDLLEGTPVRFVGTATIGFDHIDTRWLEEHDIRWVHSPGCNADSVAEYIVAALLHLATRHGLQLADRTIGIIGVGNVGSRVAARTAALGLRVLLNDPPRAARNEAADPAFISREQLLAEADIVTLHVPLEAGGDHPTVGLANRGFFSALKPGATFINSSRGPVMDTAALLTAIEQGTPALTVIDTWEHEPAISNALLSRVSLATPHIAGYSFDGKVNGTRMVYEALCAFSGNTATWQPNLPPPDVPRAQLDSTGPLNAATLQPLVRSVYDILVDDRALRTLPANVDMAQHFKQLRSNYRQRREFEHTQLTLSDSTPAGTRRALSDLGFS